MVDLSHVVAMGTLAAVLSGSINAIWLRSLEEAVPGHSRRAVLLKTVADYCIAGVLMNSAYLVGVPLVTSLFAGEPLDVGGWSLEGFIAAMRCEACTFVPYK